MGTPFNQLAPHVQAMVMAKLNEGKPVGVARAVEVGKVEFEVKETKPRQQTESASQQDLIKWWALACLEHSLPDNALMAFPLQGARTKANASRMKAEGMRRGSPDLLLTVPTLHGHALFIEMKSEKGRLSVYQKEMLCGLERRGYSTVVCMSTDDAKAAIGEYLKWRETA